MAIRASSAAWPYKIIAEMSRHIKTPGPALSICPTVTIMHGASGPWPCLRLQTAAPPSITQSPCPPLARPSTCRTRLRPAWAGDRLEHVYTVTPSLRLRRRPFQSRKRAKRGFRFSRTPCPRCLCAGRTIRMFPTSALYPCPAVRKSPYTTRELRAPASMTSAPRDANKMPLARASWPYDPTRRLTCPQIEASPRRERRAAP